MMSISLLLYGLAALGALIVSSLYLFGRVPTSYHREILEREGVALSPGLELMMTALCRVFGAALMASSVSALLFALNIQPADPVLIKIRPLLIGLIVGVPCAIYPHRVEIATGVRTPWRSAVGLIAVLLAGFAFSIL